MMKCCCCFSGVVSGQPASQPACLRKFFPVQKQKSLSSSSSFDSGPLFLLSSYFSLKKSPSSVDFFRRGRRLLLASLALLLHFFVLVKRPRLLNHAFKRDRLPVCFISLERLIRHSTSFIRWMNPEPSIQSHFTLDISYRYKPTSEVQIFLATRR